MERGFETKCIYGDGEKFEGEQTGSISFPIYQIASFAHPAVGQSTGFDYSRIAEASLDRQERAFNE